jgi:hypothetical protein
MAVNMHRHDGSGSWRNFLLDIIYVHAPGFSIAVYEHRDSAVVDGRHGARDDGKGGHDHFIARFQSQTGNGKL